MKKLLVAISLTIVVSLFFPKKTFAQNKCGVNVGPNYHQVDSVASLTKSGGWVVALGTLGNCSGFESLFGKGLNVVIRAYNGGKAFTNEEAIAWTATLGKLDTKGQKVYFMPWNEPNHQTEGGSDTAGNQAYQYSVFLKNALNNAGLLGTKVILLSPMVDKLNPSFINGTFFTNPGGKSGFYSAFDGSSINEYDQFSPGPCSSGVAEQNNCKYDQIGIPGSFYALETGVAGTAIPPRYVDGEIRQMLDAVWSKWQSDGNFRMFAIFSYDPHRSGWNIFSANQTKRFYQNACSAGGVTAGAFDPKQKFDQWFSQNETQLVNCSNTCGYAPKNNPSLCSGVSGTGYNRKPFIPARNITTSDTERSISDTVLLSQKSPSWPIGATGSANVTKGGFFDKFQDLTIPFARDLTEYLAGPFVYQWNTYIKETVDQKDATKFRPLAKLTPDRIQDEFRHEYWKSCLDGTFCSSKNIGTSKCPNKDNNECLSADGKTEFQEFCPPPREEFTKLPTFPALCPKKQDDWLGRWAAKWTEVPLFSNPKTEVKNSILMNTCPYPSHVSTTTLTRTPWVSALNDVSSILYRLFSPSKPIGQTSLPNQLASGNREPTLLASLNQGSDNKLLAQAEPEKGIHLGAKAEYDASAGKVTVNVKIYSDGCDGHFKFKANGVETIPDQCCVIKGWPKYDPYNIDPKWNLSPFPLGKGQSVTYNYWTELTLSNCPHKSASISCVYTVDPDGNFSSSCGEGAPGTQPQPTCAPPSPPNFISTAGNDDPVYSEGHTLLKEDRYIGCEEWDFTGGPHCKKLKDALSYDIKDPTWAEIDYPFLRTIYQNLSGPYGLFMILFKPEKIDPQNWGYAADSNITYCLTDHPAGNMIKGGSLEIDKQPFNKPDARCERPLYTKGVRAFPSFIGGVYSAKEWVREKLLNPPNF